MTHDELERIALSNPEVKAEYDALRKPMYQILTFKADDLQEAIINLNTAVNAAMRDGWIPCGSVVMSFMWRMGEKNPYVVAQALVKLG